MHRAPTTSITKLGIQVLQVSPRYADRGKRNAVHIDMIALKVDNFVSGVKKLTNRAQSLACRCIKFAAESRPGIVAKTGTHFAKRLAAPVMLVTG